MKIPDAPLSFQTADDAGTHRLLSEPGARVFVVDQFVAGSRK